MKTQADSAHNLLINITPDTVYTSPKPGQDSMANLAITIINKSVTTEVIKAISVTLPLNLASQKSLTTIKPESKTALWLFAKSTSASNQFDTKPKSGSTVNMAKDYMWGFNLNTITLVNTIIEPVTEVLVRIRFNDGTLYEKNVKVAIKPTTAIIDNFSVEPAEIEEGQVAKLMWTCHNIKEVLIDHQIGVKLASGEQAVSPLEDTTYSMYAKGEDNEVLFAQVTVTVKTGKIISFSSSAVRAVPIGATVTLRWQCSEAIETAILSNNGGFLPFENQFNGATARLNSVSFAPITKPTTFTLSAAKRGDTQYLQEEKKIEVIDATAAFSATPDTGIWQRDKIRLNWDIANVIEVNISPAVESGPSLQKLKGWAEVVVERDITYTLTVKGFEDNKPRTLIQTINLHAEQVEIYNFYSTPEPRGPQPVYRFNWNVKAQVRTIDREIGNIPAQGTAYPKQRHTTYTLSAGTTQNPAILTQSITLK